MNQLPAEEHAKILAAQIHFEKIPMNIFRFGKAGEHRRDIIGIDHPQIRTPQTYPQRAFEFF